MFPEILAEKRRSPPHAVMLTGAQTPGSVRGLSRSLAVHRVLLLKRTHLFGRVGNTVGHP